MKGTGYAILYVPSYTGYTLDNCFNNNLVICDSLVTGFGFNPNNGLYHVALSKAIDTSTTIQLMCIYTYNKSSN